MAHAGSQLLPQPTAWRPVLASGEDLHPVLAPALTLALHPHTSWDQTAPLGLAPTVPRMVWPSPTATLPLQTCVWAGRPILPMPAARLTAQAWVLRLSLRLVWLTVQRVKALQDWALP